MSPRGFIEIDDSRQTAEPGIYAIGDEAGEPMLAHKASHEGRAAVDAIAGDRNVKFEPAAIPAVVFTDPEIAWAGLTETEAEKQGRHVAVAKTKRDIVHNALPGKECELLENASTIGARAPHRHAADEDTAARRGLEACRQT